MVEDNLSSMIVSFLMLHLVSGCIPESSLNNRQQRERERVKKNNIGRPVVTTTARPLYLLTSKSVISSVERYSHSIELQPLMIYTFSLSNNNENKRKKQVAEKKEVVEG